jgi:hypothetical protein
MFQIGAKVKLVRHDQYPQLIGLKGVVAASDDLPEGVPPPIAGESLYQVHANYRTLYAIPESWLVRN